MSQPDRSTVPRRSLRPRARPRLHALRRPSPSPNSSPSPSRPPKPRSVALLACTAALALTTAACSGTAPSLSDPIGGHSTDPGCIAALSAVGKYGPRAVNDLAQGRVDVNKAVVHLLVLALDAAADTADQPADKQAISTLANIYEQYYQFKTNLVAVPAATLLKDTTNLDSVCKS